MNDLLYLQILYSLVAQFNDVCMPISRIKVYVVEFYDFHNKDLCQKQ